MSTPFPTPFKPGQRVVYHIDDAGLGNPAIVERVGPKRLRLCIGLPELHSYSHGLPMTEPRLKWVPREHVQPRVLPSAFFHECMECYVRGFRLGAYKHPVGATAAFPKGIWYGQIDGMEVGAPCFSAEAAVASAHACLMGTAYKTLLHSIIEQNERQYSARQHGDGYQQAKAMTDARERLAKVHALLEAGAAPQEVLLERGNPQRGPESGTGHGRWVRVRLLGLLEAENGGMQCRCQLLEDDPWACGAPDKAGDIGLWSTSSIVRWLLEPAP